MIFPIIGITARIEIELVTVGSKHLRNDVFRYHSLVNVPLNEERAEKLLFYESKKMSEWGMKRTINNINKPKVQGWSFAYRCLNPLKRAMLPKGKKQSATTFVKKLGNA